MQIVLTKSQLDILSKQAKEHSPNECCSLLFGKTKENKGVVSEVFPAENIENSQVNFRISNDQLIQGYENAEQKKLEVIGIFHSHPDSDAYPSSTDKKFMQINPVVWVIFSIKSNDFKAYLLDSQLIEIPIITEENA